MTLEKELIALKARILSLEWCVRRAIPALETTRGHKATIMSLRAVLEDTKEFHS